MCHIHVAVWLQVHTNIRLTLSLPILLRLACTLCHTGLIHHLFNFWHSGALASGLSARAHECQKLKIVGYTSVALNPSNSSNLEQLALKRLIILISWTCHWQKSPGSFVDAPCECRSTLRTSQLTWVESACMMLSSTSSVTVEYDSVESWYSFYRPTKSRKLSRPKQCSKGVHPVRCQCCMSQLTHSWPRSRRQPGMLSQ